jgi:hypothetical protein
MSYQKSLTLFIFLEPSDSYFKKNLLECDRYLSRVFSRFEIVVLSEQEDFSQLKYPTLKTGDNFGKSFNQALKQAQSEYVALLGSSQINMLECLERLSPYIGKADVLTAYFRKKATITRAIYSLLLNLPFGEISRDMRLFRAEIFRKFEFRATFPLSHAEMLAIASRQGCSSIGVDVASPGVTPALKILPHALNLRLKSRIPRQYKTSEEFHFSNLLPPFNSFLLSGVVIGGGLCMWVWLRRKKGTNV